MLLIYIMSEKAKNYISLEDEELDDYSNDDLYNIDTWGADLSFRELITMYSEDELLKPELQRNYVWDRAEASRFIESLLLGLPVPSIFLAKVQNEKTLIIDGYQRIMTVYEYVHQGIFSKDGKVFKLSNTNKINPKWRGKAFSELTDTEQRKIKSTTIHSIFFRQKEPKDDDTSLFQVFERINTGGRTLTSQEIRNCVYQGDLNRLLIKLNDYPEWRQLFGTKAADPRMKDIEFILRFLALVNFDFKTLKSTSISLKKFLNDYMGLSKNNENEEILRLEKVFKETMAFILTNMGSSAFFNVSQSNPKKIVNKIHPTLFDAISVATAIYISNQLNPPLVPVLINEKRIELLNNSEFKNFTTIRTTNKDNIIGRISKALEIIYGSSY